MEDFRNMKDKITIFAIVIFMLLSIQSFVWSEMFSFHANGGLSLPKEKNINSGFETGFGFAFPINKKISISFNFGFWKSGVEAGAGKLMKGKLTVTPFLASIHYCLFEKKIFIPYFFVGAGYVFNSFKIGEYITIPEVKITQKIEAGPAFQAGLGSQILISRKLALFAEAFYLYRQAEGTTTISDMNFGLSSEKFTLNMSSFFIGLGIKYYL